MIGQRSSGTPPGRARRAAMLSGGLIVLLLIGYGLGEISRHGLSSVDLDVVGDLARRRTGALTAVAHGLSVLGRSVVIFPLAVVTAAWLRRAGRTRGAALLLVSVFGAWVLYNVDKVLVERPRPPFHHLEAVGHWSFPSGHATLASAFYLALALVASAPSGVGGVRALASATLLAGAIALSRVYLAVHYPTDVVAGMLLGAAWCVFAARVLRAPRRP